MPERLGPSASQQLSDLAGIARTTAQQHKHLQSVLPSVLMASTAEGGRPLNVTDALSYLDLVKNKFRDSPEVYNHFLDIMKEFKGQSIDTPGVIQRVSMLFHGHSELIGGFNTFLPPGYRIELAEDPREDVILVTTPMGVITQPTDGSMGRLVPSANFTQPPPFNNGSATQNLQNLVLNASSLRPITPHPPTSGLPFTRVQQPQPISGYHDMPPPGSYSPAGLRVGAQTPNDAAVSILGNLSGRNPMENNRSSGGQTGEFNHAIQYLNKIKMRYSDDQNTYKSFLEILQTYQKEQRHLHDSQVYAQVQMLFKDAPDLLDEFKDFLPEALGEPIPPSSGLIGILPQPNGSWNQSESHPEKPAKGGSRRKKRGAEKEPPQKPTSARAAKKVKYNHKSEPQSPTFAQYQLPPSPPPLSPHYAMMQPSQTPLAAHQIQPAYIQTVPSLTAHDELLFFDRAKKALEDRETYEDFLKLLNLYSKDVIDTKTLVAKVEEVFLGDGDLLAQFRELIDWDDQEGGIGIEWGPPGGVRMGPPEALSAMPVDDGLGPSYRRCPESELRLACSGRNELCRSVLNDEWVSHPTWASEESGFVAHKKNSYEEALHKSEEERHEYQVHIDALARTLAILEPLNARIDEMTHEERTLFKLKSDFGGSRKSIYHKIIKKAYGREAGIEVIQALQDCPSVAVPVVLARLRQKEDDWKRAQREWGRTWKEVDAKNFYKSLDHQGLIFKANDKKNITAKHFVHDIESIKAGKRDKEEESPFNKSLGFQLEYEFQDNVVLHDSLKIVYSFLDHNPTQYSFQERRSIEKFLRSFVPLLCMYPAHEFNVEFELVEDMMEEDIVAVGDGIDDGRRSVNEHGQEGVLPADLRKRLLKTAQETAYTKSRSASASPGDPGPNQETIKSKIDYVDVWTKESVASLAPGQVSAGKTPVEKRPFFANTTFYTLLRLLQLLYFRLHTCKEIGAKLAEVNHAPLLANPVAVQLGLDEPLGPSSVLAQVIEAFGSRTNGSSNILYMYLLDACEKVFDNELDQTTFEEHMRWFFGTKAYYLFTLDKLIVAIIKQVQTIEADTKCQELWDLLQATRRAETLNMHDIIGYRREAEQHVGSDENLYRFEWENRSKTLRMQLLGDNDPSIDEDGSSLGRWREYVSSYVTRHPTEWMPAAITRMADPFLPRTLTSTEEENGSSVETEGDMPIRVSCGKYKIFYEAGSEWYMSRRRCKEDRQALEERALVRGEERKRCRWLTG